MRVKSSLKAIQYRMFGNMQLAFTSCRHSRRLVFVVTSGGNLKHCGDARVVIFLFTTIIAGINVATVACVCHGRTSWCRHKVVGLSSVFCFVAGAFVWLLCLCAVVKILRPK